MKRVDQKLTPLMRQPPQPQGSGLDPARKPPRMSKLPMMPAGPLTRKTDPALNPWLTPELAWELEDPTPAGASTSTDAPMAAAADSSDEEGAHAPPSPAPPPPSPPVPLPPPSLAEQV